MIETEQSADALSALLRNLPERWLDIYERALVACKRRARPPRDQHALLRRVTGLMPHAGAEVNGFAHCNALLTRLSREVGLDLFAALPDTLEPAQRLAQALAQAEERYHAQPEHERVLDPASALGQIAKATSNALAAIAISNSHDDFRALPSIAPLAVLSAPLALMDRLVRAVGHRIAGQSEQALEIYDALLSRMAQPDGAGLEPSYHLHTRVRIMGAVGTLEAAMGRSSSLRWADAIAGETHYEITALLVRRLYHLFQGNLPEARRTKQQIELLRLESNTRADEEAHQLFMELCGYALARDTTGLRQALQALAPYEPLHASFRPAVHYARGEQCRLRGDHANAQIEIERALLLMRPGEHVLWANAASAHVQTLLDLGDVAQARALGASYLESGEPLGYRQEYLRASWSIVLSRSGEHDAAAAEADAAIEHLKRLGVTGLNLAVAYEARAQVAKAAGDLLGAQQFAKLYGQQWPPGQRRLPWASGGRLWEVTTLDDSDALSELSRKLEQCETLGDRARCGLELVASHLGALGGVLFARAEEGLVRAACFGELGPEHDLSSWANAHFQRETCEHVTEDSGKLSRPLAVAAETLAHVADSYMPVLLAREDARGYAVTGVMVFVEPALRQVAYAGRLASTLSRSVASARDVVPLYL